MPRRHRRGRVCPGQVGCTCPVARHKHGPRLKARLAGSVGLPRGRWVVKKSTRVLVTGPLAPYAAGYRAELDAQGYSAWTAVSYLYSFARLSRWLAAQGLAAGDLDGAC